MPLLAKAITLVVAWNTAERAKLAELLVMNDDVLEFSLLQCLPEYACRPSRSAASAWCKLCGASSPLPAQNGLLSSSF